MGDMLLVNQVQWNEREINNVLDVFTKNWFASGHYVTQFQKALGDKFGGRFFLTNSGSTALETAVMTLMKFGKVKPGDYVLHPALTFNTSASCFAKFGMVPVFVDAAPGTYNMDIKQAEEAIEQFDINLVVIPYILGNTTDISKLRELAWKRNIPIIGDSCDTLGTEWNSREMGNWADMTAYSFYGSHHITTAGVGGALRVNNEVAEETIKSLIYWGRDWEAEQTFANRYAYATLGSDYQMTEIQAAFGLAQLSRLDEYNDRRRTVFNAMLSAFLQNDLQTYFVMPLSHPSCNPSWFGFPLTISYYVPFSRDQFISKLLLKNIECRPMFSGNTVKQKAWKFTNALHPFPLPVADRALTHSFFLPAWAMPDDALHYLIESVVGVVKELTNG